MGGMDAVAEAQVRHYWPDATWFPWSECPIGQRVRDSNGNTGIILGVQPTQMRRPHECPDCHCTPIVAGGPQGWWEMQVDGWWRDGEIYRKLPAQPGPDATPMVLLKYPPELVLMTDL
jgi:hypothetical protein